MIAYKSNSHLINKIYRYIIISMATLLFIYSSHSQSENKLDSTNTYSELTKMLDIARSNNDQKTLAQVYLKLGDYEGEYFSDFGKSLDYYQRSLEYFKVLKDDEGVHAVNQAIAKRYIKVGFYNDAEQILKNLEKVYQNDNSKLYTLYFDLSQLYKEKLEFEWAEDYLNRAEKLSLLNRDTLMFINILFDKIDLEQLSTNLDTALIRSFDAFN